MFKELDAEDIKLEKDALDQSTALNKIVIRLLEDRKKEALRSWMALIIACCVFVASVGAILYDTYRTKEKLLAEMAQMRQEFTKALDDERNAWIEYVQGLETTTAETVSTETTQTVEGDSANIVNGNQYNDKATHNDSKGKGGDE